jgi:hypothetical protein
MSADNPNTPHGLNLDADAVCAMCGTVNPEGTLICKVCGNNLRDQRVQRMHSEQSFESAIEPPASRRWVAGVLTAIGALLVILVAINVDSIVSYAVVGDVGGGGVDVMWNGDQSGVFDTLSADLKALAPTQETFNAAIEATVPLEEGAELPAMDGAYVLYPANATPDAPHLGTAIVRMEGTEYAFVAQLEGGFEIRGWASERSAGLLTADAQRAASFDTAAYRPVYGYAQQESDGTVTGWGQLQEASEADLIGFVAYRLP